MLFDDNLGFMAYNLYPNMMNNKNTTNSNDLVSVDEGFFRGNMFKNEYKPYKNYTYKKIVPKTKKEELLLEIMELSFVINDLNLYLDLYPNDGNALDLFNKYRKEANRLMMDYEDKYGPILVSSDSLDTSPFLWQTLIFPWNMEGLSNV